MLGMKFGAVMSEGMSLASGKDRSGHTSTMAPLAVGFMPKSFDVPPSTAMIVEAMVTQIDAIRSASLTR